MKLFIRSLFTSATSLFIACVGLVLLRSVDASAQISATPSNNATQLAQSLVGAGVTVTNATLACPTDGAGFFTATAQSLSIGNGVVLTTGHATDIANPNDGPGNSFDGGASVIADAPGDATLENLVDNTTHDACVLQFDLVPQGDTLRFNYIFGSEEYNEFVNSIYNDVFGFFISGPGIPGQQNIARIPGTNLPVTINNVNCGSYGQYYVCNDWSDPFEGSCSGQCPNGQQPYSPEYDGLTTQLTAKAIVQPCQTYHLKLAVADVGDGAYDSGVFIKQGSLTSASVSASPDATLCPGQSTPLNATGASSNASFQWSPPDGLSCADCQNPTAAPTVTTTYTVTASTGVGCSTSDQVVVTVAPPVSATLIATPADCNVSNGAVDVSTNSGTAPFAYHWSNGSAAQNLSAVPSGVYAVTVSDANNCSASYSSTVASIGAPTVSGSAFNSTCGLPNGSVDLSPQGTQPFTFNWSNGETTEDPNALVANVYTVTVTDAAGCTVLDTFDISTTTVPAISFTTVDPICSAANGTVDVTVANGTPPFAFAWSTGETTEDLIGVAASTYHLTVTDSSGCTANTDIPLVAELAAPMTLNGLVDSLCVGSGFTAVASGYMNYTWSPAAGLSATTGDSVTVTPLTNETYTVIGTDENGCADTLSFNVAAVPYAFVSYSDTFAGCEPLPVHLVASPSNASSVEWWIDGYLASTHNIADVSLGAGTHDGMLVAVSPLGCNDTTFMPGFAYVLQSPVADFIFSRNVPSNSLFVFDFTNQTTFGTSYLWSFGDGTTDPSTNPQHTFPAYGYYKVLLTATNEVGCSDTSVKTVPVTVPHDVFIPNTITPNNDGRNESFNVFGLGIRSYRCVIYDRLGEKIFEGTNDLARWDGTYRGKAVNTGTYVYVVDVEFLDDREQRFAGDINVLR